MELMELLRFLTLCMLFSKKPFPVFLETAGYTHEDVLLQKPKAGVGHISVNFLLAVTPTELVIVTIYFLFQTRYPLLNKLIFIIFG